MIPTLHTPKYTFFVHESHRGFTTVLCHVPTNRRKIFFQPFGSKKNLENHMRSLTNACCGWWFGEKE